MLEARRVYPSSSTGPAGQASDPEPGLQIVVVGVASRDLVADDPRGWRLGGSATYCSLTAARLGLRVGCLLGVDADAAEAAELDQLRAAGVSLRLVGLKRGPVFENLEIDGHRRQRWHSASDSLPSGELPSAWRGAGAWLAVPIAGELGVEWAGIVADGAALGVGWQGLLRTFDGDGWVKRARPTASPLLAKAGLVVASVDDVAGDVVTAELRALAPAATIVLTAGEGGGIALREGRIASYRAVPAGLVVDATGAGDVFLAALMTAWILTGKLATAATLRFAAAAASCVVGDIGLAGVPTANQVAARLRGRTRAG